MSDKVENAHTDMRHSHARTCTNAISHYFCPQKDGPQLLIWTLVFVARWMEEMRKHHNFFFIFSHESSFNVRKPITFDLVRQEWREKVRGDVFQMCTEQFLYATEVITNPAFSLMWFQSFLISWILCMVAALVLYHDCSV